MFIDRVRMTVSAGNGGDGAVSFHTEKYVPNGGPDGGDGGRGGDVVFVARSGLSTLQAFRYRRKFQAEHGQKGGTRKQYGRSGQNLELDVPVGTLVREAETGHIVADLVEDGQRAVIAKGGRGGKGNTHFANSVRQAPRFARAGEAGDSLDLIVELKLIADVGLVGFPNAGKSTLLSVVSEAKPKIGDYPFTTVEPGLGVVTVGDTSFVMADIPGLIAGAHTGLGLGLAFLRHIERTRLLVHVVDMSPDSGNEPLAGFDQINNELASYDPGLASRPQIVALNKTDLADPEVLRQTENALRERGCPVFPICAPIGEGVTALIQAVAAAVQSLPPVQLFDPEKERTLYRLETGPLFEIKREEDVYRVSGDWIENLVRSTNFDQHESLHYFQRLIRRKGVIESLEKAGIQEGDLVDLAGFEFNYYP
ncbi:MAG: GTPase ObgE [Clostridiaceae bacterium]|nr:GTPase ObgE [Clostridiaceae bacterium]